MKDRQSPRLEHRVLVLNSSKSEDTFGGVVDDEWVVVATVRAEYLPVSDAERLRAAAIQQKTEARFKVRKLRNVSAIDGTYRLRFDGDDWRIEGVKPVGRGFLEITAWRVKRQGGNVT